MPAASAAFDAIAFDALIERRGETVSLKRADGTTATGLSALINRTGPPPNLNSAADGGDKTGAVIWFPTTVSKPAVGEIVIDDQLNKHRITEVTYLGHCWECKCATRNAG